jgi:hypothetical protein
MDVISLIRAVKELAARAGGHEKLKEQLDAVAE